MGRARNWFVPQAKGDFINTKVGGDLAATWKTFSIGKHNISPSPGQCGEMIPIFSGYMYQCIHPFWLQYEK